MFYLTDDLAPHLPRRVVHELLKTVTLGVRRVGRLTGRQEETSEYLILCHRF